MILRSFKYRLYPTKEQETLFSKHFGCARFIYNFGLNAKIEAYQKENKSITCIDIANNIPEMKIEKEWLKEVNSQSLQMSLRNLDNAYQRFFRLKKGFPKFKSKHGKQSFQVPQNAEIKDNKLYMPKFKEGIKIKLHRSFEGNIKTVTISKSPSGKYFASILVETPDVIPSKPKLDESRAIGIDLGIKTFAVCSNGETFANPKYLKKSLAKLKRLQRSHSRKVKGSKNRNKSRIKLARQYEKVTNQRNDFLNKVSYKLTHENQVDTICLETLNIAGMVKNHNLAQSISDCSWSKFVSMLEYKAEWYGKNILRIGQWLPSSKMCSCGLINTKLTLKDREWTCECGLTHDRDRLASINILHFAFHKQNLIGQGLSSTPNESSFELIDLGSYALSVH